MELFDESTTNFVLTSFPVTISPENASSYQPSEVEKNMVSPMLEPSSTQEEDAAKKEIRRLKDRIRRRKTIIRRRNERQALNQQIDELSTQLEELKRKAETNMSAPAWITATSRQIQSWQKLTDERRRLREEVRKRADFIRDLESLFHDQLQEIDSQSTTKSKCTHLKQDLFLFRQYVLELDSVYKQTNEILESCVMESSSIIKTTREKQEGTDFFQSCGKQLMPFEYRQTCYYLWQLVVLAHRQEDRQFYHDVEDPENTVAIKFRFQQRSDEGYTASLLVHHVIRRYDEEDRMVMVWRTLTEGEGVFRGMHSDETGWCVVHPSTLNSCTKVEACNRVVPMDFGTSIAQVGTKDQFTSMILRAVEEDILQISIKLDRLLLGEAIRQIGDVGVEM